ncbi:MAG TPA: LCP family protein [Clostridia bacterium]|nr:LCP family protein [Clostridia bacterium]
MKNITAKKKKAIIVICALILVVAIPATGVFIFVNSYLNKINYDNNTTLEIDPSFTEDLSGADFDEADEDIEENLLDTRFWYNEDVINILLIGYDYGGGGKYYGRSDAMIIASINKRDNKISYVSLSRATYVSIPGHGNARLNAAYAYGGPNLLIETIEQNYKTRIDNYVSVDFSGFTEIIDNLGGVSIELTDKEFNYLRESLDLKGIGTSKGAGTYKFDGELALKYARTRSIDTDRARTQRQRNILKALTYKAKNISLSKGLELLDDLLPIVTTDFNKKQLVAQSTNAMKYISWDIDEALIPRDQPGLIEINGIEVIILDWTKVRNDIHEQLYPNMEPVESLPDDN